MAIYKNIERSTGGGFDFILSDGTPDRFDDVVEPGGWLLDNFKKNPVALWAHKSDFVIGRWVGLHVAGGALRGTLQFAPEGTSDRIDELIKLTRSGILRGVSVGFRPLEQRPRGANQKGMIFSKQELVEASLVAVPALPSALAVAKSLHISNATRELVFARSKSRSGKQKRPMPRLPTTDDKFLKLVEQESRFARRVALLAVRRESAIWHLELMKEANTMTGANMSAEIAEALRNLIEIEKQTKAVKLALRFAQDKIRGGRK